MATILKTLFGSGINEEELSVKLRSVVSEMQMEKQQFERLVAKASDSGEHLNHIAKIGDRLSDIERQMGAFEKLVPQIAIVEGQAENFEKRGSRIEKQLADSAAEVERIEQQAEAVNQKLNTAQSVKDELSGVLELAGPLKALRSEADDLTGQFRYLTESFNRVREQHESITDGQKHAASRLESFDNEYQRLTGAVDGAEKRVQLVEQSLENLTQIAPGVRDTKHQLAILKSLADQVNSKVAGLEQQRGAVERATSQAGDLNNVMRQFDAAVQKQQENAKTLSEYQARADELKALQSTVLDRSGEITTQQRQIAEESEELRANLAATREEARKSMDRFELERQGVDSASQRIADLRGALTNFEERFGALHESNETITGIRTKADSLTSQLSSIADDVSRLDEQAEKARTVRASVEELDRVVHDVTERVERVEAAQPAVETALRDLGDLSRSHEAVADALEQTQLAHGELSRMADEQAETQSWVTNVQRSVGELQDQFKELSGLKPTVEFVRREATQAIESTKAIEARREVVEEMRKQLGELTSLGARVDDRTKGLVSRMEVAEGRFERLSQQSEEAERLSNVISMVRTGVEDSEQRIANVGASVEGLEKRSQNLEALSERVRQLGSELDQRQGSLEKASEHLERASTLRQESATAAQELEEHLRSLTSKLTSAEKLANRTSSLSDELEDRSNSLRFVEKRMVQFEEQLAKWESTEAEVAHALEHVAVRQGTIDTLQVDIRQMFEMAERTVADVRTITAAQEDVGRTRGLLDEVIGRIGRVEDTGKKLEQRKRQVEQVEARLARADAMILDVQSSIETLQNQKSIVDHVVEKAGTLTFQTRQAEALIQILREERDLIGTRIRSGAPPKKQKKPPAPELEQFEAKAG